LGEEHSRDDKAHDQPPDESAFHISTSLADSALESKIVAY